MNKTLIMTILMGAILGIIIGSTGATWIWMAVCAIVIAVMAIWLNANRGEI